MTASTKIIETTRLGQTSITIATRIDTTTQEALVSYLVGEDIPEWCAIRIAAECFDRKEEAEAESPEDQTWATIVYSPCPLFTFDRRWVIQVDQVDLFIMF